MRWLLVLLAGCSFGMNTVPDGYTPVRGGPPPDCSTTGSVGTDVLGAVAFAALAGISYKYRDVDARHTP